MDWNTIDNMKRSLDRIKNGEAKVVLALENETLDIISIGENANGDIVFELERVDENFFCVYCNATYTGRELKKLEGKCKLCGHDDIVRDRYKNSDDVDNKVYKGDME